MSIWRALGLSALILLAVATWWLARPNEPETLGKIGTRHEPDHYMEKMTLTLTDPLGKPQQVLRSETVVHYIDDDTTTLNQPHLTVFDQDQPPWEMFSDTGLVSSDARQIVLSGRVRIERAGSDSARPLKILTSNLRVRPYEGYAETDDRVSIKSLVDKIDAVGMQVHFQEPLRLHLLSKVRGTYESP